jgi:hypothetical protein
VSAVGLWRANGHGSDPLLRLSPESRCSLRGLRYFLPGYPILTCDDYAVVLSYLVSSVICCRVGMVNVFVSLAVFP